MAKNRGYRYALAVTSQFYFCGVPFRLDITPKCESDCLYCFAMSRGGRRTNPNQIVKLDYIKNKFKKVLELDIVDDISDEFIKHRVPLHFGGMSDPFSSVKTSQVAKDILGMLARYHYPTLISTKNTTLLKQFCLQELAENYNFAIQISMCCGDNDFSSVVEPKLPNNDDRLSCMKLLSDKGTPVICRLQPLFLIKLDDVSNHLIERLSNNGCQHVVVEFLKLPVERKMNAVDDMLKKIKWDAYEDYKSLGAKRIGREYILPADIKWNLLKTLIKKIHDNGMTYGAGDYGLHHLSDTQCCCGIDKINGFENWFKSNMSQAIISSRDEKIRFDKILSEWNPQKSIKQVLNSTARSGSNDQRIVSYIKEKWNSDSIVNSPGAYLGVFFDGEMDSDGNRIYKKA